MSVNEKMATIADAIREKTGKTAKLSLDAMASSIGEVHQFGYVKGETAGVDTGRLLERQEFWNNVPSAYNAKYKFAGPAWNSYTFYPTRDLTFKAIPIDYAFMQHAIEGPAYDLAQRLEECGVTLDFSKVTRATETFKGARFTRLPELNFGSVTSMNRAFQDMSELVTIDKLIVSGTTFNDTFSGCTALRYITVEGTIVYDINFSDCPLSIDSITSIIGHLKDYSGTSTTRTITFGEKNKDNITVGQIAITSGMGWTLV